MTKPHQPSSSSLRSMGPAAAVALLAALAAPLPAVAASGPEGGHPHHHAMAPMPATVSVTGQGEAATAPDRATVRLGVTVQAGSAAEAMAANAELQRKVMAALLDAGVETRDVQTSDLGLDAIQSHPGDGQAPEIAGYRARNIVTVRVRDLDRLGEVLDGAIGAGANEVQGIDFSREDTGEVEAEARKRAVENARSHAEAIAGAAGMRLGRLLSISEGGSAGPIRPLMMRAMADGVGASIPVSEGELSVTAQVSAIWQLRTAEGEPQEGGEEAAPADTGAAGADAGAGAEPAGN